MQHIAPNIFLYFPEKHLEMPVCTVLLLGLDIAVPDFLAALRNSPVEPLTIARVVRWIITPTVLSKQILLSQEWDVLLILPAGSNVPPRIHGMIRSSWAIQAGIPSNLISTYPATNSQLLHPSNDSTYPLTNAPSQLKLVESTQALELTPELHNWIQTDRGPRGAVSMLNLLAFKPGRKEQYMKYGKAFLENVGSRRGGVAKLVGKIVPNTCSDGCNEWEEVWPSTRMLCE